MSRKILNPTLPGGLLTPVSGGTGGLTAEEIALVENLQQGNYQSETPAGTIDGVNTTFTLTVAPSPASSLKLYVNGQLLTGGGTDYTLTTNSIALVNAPVAGDILRAWYLNDA